MVGFDPEDQMHCIGRVATLSAISPQSKNNIWHTVSKSYQRDLLWNSPYAISDFTHVLSETFWPCDSLYRHELYLIKITSRKMVWCPTKSVSTYHQWDSKGHMSIEYRWKFQRTCKWRLQHGGNFVQVSRSWSNTPETVCSLQCIRNHCGLLTPFGDMDLSQHWLR